MKLGIIGAGKIVQEFLPQILRLEGLEVIGIQGTLRSAERVRALCDQYQIPHAVSSFPELAALGPDAVYIAVPNDLHASFCRRALEHGFHVIVEKPMAANDREAAELAALAGQRNCFLFEAVTTPYLSGYRKIREWLPLIGDIKIVHSQYSQYSSRYDAFLAGQVLPVFDPAKAGGALMDLNLYNLHFVLGLFGTPEDSRYYANIRRGIDTSGIAILRYPGFVAACTAAKDCKGTCGSTIQGTLGRICCSYPPNLIGAVTLERNDGTVERFDDESWKTRAVPEFTEFMRIVSQGDAKACDRSLDNSLSVSRLLTRLRLEAGIRFPSDE